MLDNENNTLYVKCNYSGVGLSLGQEVTFTGYANLYYSLPQLIAESITPEGRPEYTVNIYAATIEQIVNANAAQSSKVFNHTVYRTVGILTQVEGNYFLVDGDYRLQIKSSTIGDDYNNIISYLGKRISVDLVISDCFTTTGIFRVSPLLGEDANIIPILSISEFTGSFDSYAASGETVQVSGIIYAADNYGLYILDGDNNTLYVKCNYSGIDLSLGQEVTFTGCANLYYSLPQLMAESITPEDKPEYTVNIYAATIEQIVNANAAQSSKVFNHTVYRTVGILTQVEGNYFLVDGDYRLQIKSSTIGDDYNNIISYLGKRISVDLVLSDCFTTTGIFRVSPLIGDNACIHEVNESNNPIISIPDFNNNFDSYANSGETLQVSGVVYAADTYGLFIIDENENTLYVKCDAISLGIPIGHEITFIGYANLYYTLPQFVATSATVGNEVDYNITLYTGTIQQIINANTSQSEKVFNHNIYRTTGTLIREGTYYFLVDGDHKLQIKSSAIDTDYNTPAPYIGKKVSVNIVLSDLFTTTNVFRVLPLYDTDANIEVIEPEIDDETTTDINFIMINDTHGAFTDSAEGYSIGRVDTLVESLESSVGDYIFIHNGDAFQGSYVCRETYGLAMIEALNASNLDCFVLGNHEFDWGIEKIAAYADGDLTNGEANFPFLGANIYLKGTTTRPDWIDAYAIVEQDGVKVGIIGIMGEDQESDILTRYVAAYDFVDPISIIASTAAYLRDSMGCGVVVVATHDYTYSTNNEIALLGGSSRIDAIFCGHTHQGISESILRSDNVLIPVVQCNHKNNNAQEVIITLGENNEYKSFSAQKYYPVNYKISSDVQTIITKYQNVIDESNEVIGTVNTYLSKQTLGVYAVDEMLNNGYSSYDFGKVDIAIMNTGGVRASIDAGDITRAEVFEVFPFDNTVVLVNISGALIKDLYGNNSSYFYMDIDSSIGSYTNLDDDTIYQLAIIDFVFENTRYTQFDNLSEEDYIVTNCVLRDLLMVYLDEAY